MYQLEEFEIGKVEQWMDQHLRIRDGEFRAEILDHICSAIEYEMISGAPFDEAFQTTAQTFPIAGIRRGARLIHHRKYRFMHYMIPTVIISLLVWQLPTADRSEAMAPFPDCVELIAEPPSGMPLAGYTELAGLPGYGKRIHPIFKREMLHRGIDFRARTGTPVLATGGGTIIESTFDKGYGNYILIKHDDTYHSFYAHLDENLVNQGDEVEKGAVIAKVGSTGISVGPHLHYEVRRNGSAVDPAPYCRP